jgi:hypothetical protein
MQRAWMSLGVGVAVLAGRAFGGGTTIDVDGDGQIEIAALTEYVATPAANAESRVVRIFVEQRLADISRSREGDPLHAALARHAADLEREGFAPRVELVTCPPAPVHQDGRYVLAFRQLLRESKRAHPNLEGAVFVGHFPEAVLVRTVNWHRSDAFTLRAGKPNETKYPEGTTWIRSVPELIAHRADIVLADLDGDWAATYTAPRTPLPSVNGAFPSGISASGGGVAVDAEWSTIDYEDFFHVDDGQVIRGDDGALFAPPSEGADLECSAADGARSNRMAVPEVSISRIDARGVALALRPELRGADGKPRAGKLAPDAKSWHMDPWVHDAGVELDLLLDYFARNHAYRSGELEVAFRPAAAAHGLWSGFDILRAASPHWAKIDAAGLDLPEGDLRAVAKWLRTPAVLRTIRAHSDPWGSVYAQTDAAALLAENGGVAWSFAIEDGEFKPSLGPACGGGKLDYFLLKTLHANGLMGQGASFYIHTGCEAISPGGAGTLSFDHPGYGLRNGAEAMLFFADGLALVGRAKVFYDEPRGFCEALAEGKTFGAAWRRYFELESAAKSWGEVGDDIGRKRAYFWSVLGDWTLTLREPAP